MFKKLIIAQFVIRLYGFMLFAIDVVTTPGRAREGEYFRSLTSDLYHNLTDMDLLPNTYDWCHMSNMNYLPFRST